MKEYLKEFNINIKELKKEVNKIKRDTAKSEWRKRGSKVIPT